MNRQFSIARWRYPILALTLLPWLTTCGAHAGTFSTIDLSPIANDSLALLQPVYPTGLPVILGGVPFQIEPVGNNIYNADIAAGGGPGTVSVDIPINLSGVAAVHTLINTGWGQPGPDSLASLTFHFADSSSIVYPLIGGVDIRDHFNGEWTNTIGGSTTNVFSTVLNGHAGLGEYRIDKQYFDLSLFSSKTLTSVTLTDSGSFEFQRAYLFGLTVEAVPEPSGAALAALAAGILATWQVAQRRRCPTSC